MVGLILMKGGIFFFRDIVGRWEVGFRERGERNCEVGLFVVFYERILVFFEKRVLR